MILSTNIKNLQEKMMKEINWGMVFICAAIILLAVSLSVWQSNTDYLWIMLLLLATGGIVE